MYIQWTTPTRRNLHRSTGCDGGTQPGGSRDLRHPRRLRPVLRQGRTGEAGPGPAQLRPLGAERWWICVAEKTGCNGISWGFKQKELVSWDMEYLMD